jgi:hypothetical protein
MFRTTRFLRPMLKCGPRLALVLLAAVSFVAPAFSAEETRICCFLPDYRSNLPVPNYQQPVPNYRQALPNYRQPAPYANPYGVRMSPEYSRYLQWMRHQTRQFRYNQWLQQRQVDRFIGSMYGR